MRQAVQGLGGKGGPVWGNDGQRPIGGTRRKGFDAEKMGLRMREMGDDAFPGNGSPKINRDHEIVKLERENETLKNSRAFLSQGHA